MSLKKKATKALAKKKKTREKQPKTSETATVEVAKTATETAAKQVAKQRPGRVPVEKPPHNGRWLKAQLLISGVSQRDIARELGTDFATVNHIVSGNRKMRDGDARVIAGLLKMPFEEFMAHLRTLDAPKAVVGAVATPGVAIRPPEGSLNVEGYVDGALTVFMGEEGRQGLMGPKEAPIASPSGGADGGEIKVVRCQTAGSPFEGIDGALVYFEVRKGVDAECVGRLCVIEVAGAERARLRVIKRGYQAGRYGLFLLNGQVAEGDEVVLSASPVIWMKL